MKATVQIHGEGWADYKTYESEKIVVACHSIEGKEMLSVSLMDADGKQKFIEGLPARYAYPVSHRVLIED